MPYFKDSTGNVHRIEKQDNLHLLPSGCLEITEEDATAIANTPPFHEWNGAEYIVTDVESLAKHNTEQQRLAEINIEQESSGFKNKSVGWAHNKIDNIFNGATTVALLRAACVKAFKIIVVVMLK